MNGFEIPKINNEVKISQEEWNKFQEDLRIAKFKLQEINDNLEGGLTSRNLASFRNTYVINAQDSLDASYPMYVHFNIINEMIKIVSVKVSFWILNYRAYSTAAASGGAVSSASGGGETPTSSSGGSSTPTTSSGGSSTPTSAAGGVVSSASGGGETPTSSSESGTPVPVITSITSAGSVTNVGDENRSGFLPSGYSSSSVPQNSHTHTVTIAAHTHTGGSHTHTVSIANHTHTVSIANHTHTVTIAAHTHTGGAHTHNITYGIHEEANSPTIKFYVSENAGISYSDVFGGYDADKSGIDITSWLTRVGSKLIKFTSDVRARLSVQIEIKLDIKAR